LTFSQLNLAGWNRLLKIFLKSVNISFSSTASLHIVIGYSKLNMPNQSINLSI